MMSANSFKAAQHVKKMDARHRVIRASRFVLSLLRRMEKIAIDTIGPMDEDFGLNYIIVIVDCFTRYVIYITCH